MVDRSQSIREETAAALYDKHKTLLSNGDKVEATRVLEEAASLGAVYAIHDLAYYYYNADPAKRSDAIRLYKKAVGLGEGASAWNIALHYKSVNNARRFAHWKRVAEHMGFAETQHARGDEKDS